MTPHLFSHQPLPGRGARILKPAVARSASEVLSRSDVEPEFSVCLTHCCSTAPSTVPGTGRVNNWTDRRSQDCTSTGGRRARAAAATPVGAGGRGGQSKPKKGRDLVTTQEPLEHRHSGRSSVGTRQKVTASVAFSQGATGWLPGGLGGPRTVCTSPAQEKSGAWYSGSCSEAQAHPASTLRADTAQNLPTKVTDSLH